MYLMKGAALRRHVPIRDEKEASMVDITRDLSSCLLCEFRGETNTYPTSYDLGVWAVTEAHVSMAMANRRIDFFIVEKMVALVLEGTPYN